MRKSNLLFIVLAVIACYVQEKVAIEKFKDDRTALIHSLELFKQTQILNNKALAKNKEFISKYSDNQDSADAYFNRFKVDNHALNEIHSMIIKESQKVSDGFLDFLHPKFKTTYRNKFIAAVKLFYKSGQILIKNDYSDASFSNSSNITKKIEGMLESFGEYIVSIKEYIHKMHPEIEEELYKVVLE